MPVRQIHKSNCKDKQLYDILKDFRNGSDYVYSILSSIFKREAMTKSGRMKRCMLAAMDNIDSRLYFKYVLGKFKSAYFDFREFRNGKSLLRSVREFFNEDRSSEEEDENRIAFIQGAVLLRRDDLDAILMQKKGLVILNLPRSAIESFRYTTSPARTILTFQPASVFVRAYIKEHEQIHLFGFYRTLLEYSSDTASGDRLVGFNLKARELVDDCLNSYHLPDRSNSSNGTSLSKLEANILSILTRTSKRDLHPPKHNNYVYDALEPRMFSQASGSMPEEFFGPYYRLPNEGFFFVNTHMVMSAVNNLKKLGLIILGNEREDFSKCLIYSSYAFLGFPHCWTRNTEIYPTKAYETEFERYLASKSSKSEVVKAVMDIDILPPLK